MSPNNCSSSSSPAPAPAAPAEVPPAGSAGSAVAAGDAGSGEAAESAGASRNRCFWWGGIGDGPGGADGHGAAVTCLQFWNWALASGSSDSTVKMWDLRTGACHRTLSGHVRRRDILAARNSLGAQFSRRAIL